MFRLYIELQCPTMPGYGPKVCGRMVQTNYSFHLSSSLTIVHNSHGVFDIKNVKKEDVYFGSYWAVRKLSLLSLVFKFWPKIFLMNG